MRTKTRCSKFLHNPHISPHGTGCPRYQRTWMLQRIQSKPRLFWMRSGSMVCCWGEFWASNSKTRTLWTATSFLSWLKTNYYHGNGYWVWKRWDYLIWGGYPTITAWPSPFLLSTITMPGTWWVSLVGGVDSYHSWFSTPNYPPSCLLSTALSRVCHLKPMLPIPRKWHLPLQWTKAWPMFTLDPSVPRYINYACLLWTRSCFANCCISLETSMVCEWSMSG